jgi:formate dehydrogenase iron-sulfur subunit
LWRFSLAAVAGLLLPAVLSFGTVSQRSVQVVTAMMLVLLTAAEVLERYLFFRAAPSSRMPGSIR